jgi:oligoendopeptidase F
MNAPVKPLANALPTWDLGDLYSGREDPKLEADIAAGAALNRELAELKGAFIADRKAPAKLGALIDRGVGLYEAATNKLWAVGAYASLSASTSRDDPAWARFEADIRARASQIAADSLFLSLELNELEDAEIEAALAAHPAAP